jgi:hypothetical protein
MTCTQSSRTLPNPYFKWEGKGLDKSLYMSCKLFEEQSDSWRLNNSRGSTPLSVQSVDSVGEFADPH